MSREQFEDRFLDFLEGALSEEEKQSFITALETDPNLSKSFREYQLLVGEIEGLGSQQFELSPSFASHVMQRVAQGEQRRVLYLRRLFMDLVMKKNALIASFGVMATVLVAIVLLNREILSPPNKRSDVVGLKDNAPLTGGIVVPKPVLSGEGGQGAPVDPKKVKSNVARRQFLDERGEALKKEDLRVRDSDSKIDAVKDQIQSSSNLRGASPEVLGKTGQESRASANEPTSILESESDLIREKAPITNSFKVMEAIAPPEYGNSEVVSSSGYVAYEEQPRIRVSSEALSTFSIDVDTASYTNARSALLTGKLPAPESVRTEEFLNYFKYDYPVQHDLPFTLSYEIAPSPLDAERYLLKLGIKTRDVNETSKPWNLVFLIDVSGSMMPENKLPLLKRSLKLLVNQMRSGDKISLVSYAGQAGIALAPTGAQEKAKIVAAIESLGAGGSTHGSAGISTAYQLAEQNKIENGINRVILATDGDFNVGLTSLDALKKFVEERRNGGITLTTLGFGDGNYKDANLEQLADNGNGNYFYIDSFNEARKVLQTDLTATLETVAKDVKLQIEFNPANVVEYRLIGYDNRKLRKEDFANDKIDAGEIGAGHTVTAIYELTLSGTPAAQRLDSSYRYQPEKESKTAAPKGLASELGFLKIRYKEPEGATSKLVQFEIDKSKLVELSKSSNDFRWAAAVVGFAQKLRNSQFASGYTLEQVEELAQSAKGNDSLGYRREFVELVKNAISLGK